MCACSCGGGSSSLVCVFVCQVNYLNPTTIKAEICYQRPPLEPLCASLVASVHCCEFGTRSQALNLKHASLQNKDLTTHGFDPHVHPEHLHQKHMNALIYIWSCRNVTDELS